MVRIGDLMKYYVHYLKWNQEELDKLDLAYSVLKKEYDSKFLPKLFGWKFEKSAAGDTSWFSGHWAFYWHKSRISKIKNDIMKLEYHQKIGDTLIKLDKDIKEDFYSFCEWGYLINLSGIRLRTYPSVISTHKATDGSPDEMMIQVMPQG